MAVAVFQAKTARRMSPPAAFQALLAWGERLAEKMTMVHFTRCGIPLEDTVRNGYSGVCRHKPIWAAHSAQKIVFLCGHMRLDIISPAANPMHVCTSLTVLQCSYLHYCCLLMRSPAKTSHHCGDKTSLIRLVLGISKPRRA